MDDNKSKGKAKDGVSPKPSSKHASTPKSKSDIKLEAPASGVTFKCRLCEKQKPISKMKIIKRFRPVIFVCQDCEKNLQ
jgi:hypothetical protein